MLPVCCTVTQIYDGPQYWPVPHTCVFVQLPPLFPLKTHKPEVQVDPDIQSVAFMQTSPGYQEFG